MSTVGRRELPICRPGKRPCGSSCLNKWHPLGVPRGSLEETGTSSQTSSGRRPWPLAPRVSCQVVGTGVALATRITGKQRNWTSSWSATA
eukprot:16445320-Heterocapsa_arctica.AAC.1